jgi:hypothetical protein
MHADLQDLQISKTEINNLTGLEVNTIPKYSVLQDPIKTLIFVFFNKQEKNTGLYIVFGISLWILLLFMFTQYKSFFDYMIGIFAFFIMLQTLKPLSQYVQRYMKFSRKDTDIKLLSKLLEEIDKHNQLIKNIDTLDQLKSVGNPIDFQNREKVIEAIQITKADLIKALKTEKILRDNPNFNPEHFSIDLTSLQALQVSETASEYGQILDEALQIGVTIQQEMKKLS